MTLPGSHEWTFALKTFLAGLLALYISMWADLSRPYWALATVYITSQAFDGATQAKAVYRAFGTLIGAAMAVVILPNVVNSPELTVVIIALWVAVCLYISLLDRTSRSYMAMLAGYTVALSSFPAVDDPGSIFETAVTRAEEITLGIVCAALVSGIVFPRSALPVFDVQLEAWLTSAQIWTREVLCREPRAKMDTRAGRLKLASDAIALETLGSQMRHEASRMPVSEESLSLLRQHMLMLLPILTSISDRLKAIEGTETDLALRPLLEDIAAWFQTDDASPAEAQALLERLDASERGLRKADRWADLLLAGLVDRLQDIVNLKQDIRLIRNGIVTGVPFIGPYSFKYTAKACAIRHRDRAMALLSASTSFIAIVLVCVVWIATDWNDGSTAAMMAAVATCLFATQDDPAPKMKGFTTASLAGIAGVVVYQFTLMPQANSFEMVALALAPGLILGGLLMARPATAAFGLGATINFAVSLALHNSYSADFAALVNSGLALAVGMCLATACVAMIRSLDAMRAVKRLHRQNRESLVLAASGRGAESGLELAALMLDRIGLMASRLSTLPPNRSAVSGELLREVRTGINVVELRRVRRHMSEAGRKAINLVLAGVARFFRTEGDPPQSLLMSIDKALALLEMERDSADTRAAILGLAGLRRSLFRAAPVPRLEADRISPAEVA